MVTTTSSSDAQLENETPTPLGFFDNIEVAQNVHSTRSRRTVNSSSQRFHIQPVSVRRVPSFAANSPEIATEKRGKGDSNPQLFSENFQELGRVVCQAGVEALIATSLWSELSSYRCFSSGH